MYKKNKGYVFDLIRLVRIENLEWKNNETYINLSFKMEIAQHADIMVTPYIRFREKYKLNFANENS